MRKSFHDNVRRRSVVVGKVDTKYEEDIPEKKLFERTGDSFPVLSNVKGVDKSLQVRGKEFEGNEIVVEDATTKEAVAVVERKYATIGNVFNIYSTKPVYEGQMSANILKYKVKLYHFAVVKPSGHHLDVIMEGHQRATYKIFPDEQVIRKFGKVVASAQDGAEGDAVIMTVDENTDPVLMFCLAAIADDASVSK